MRIFHQGLANPLSDAAMHLAFDNHWIDQIAKIITTGPVDKLYNAGCRVNFNLGNMRARRIGEVQRVIKGGFFKPGFQPVMREIMRHIG